MKKTKTILSVLLTAIILLTMFTAVPFSVSAADGVYHVTNSEQLVNAYSDINSHNSGTFDVYIDKSFETLSGFAVEQPVTVNIFGEGNTITFKQAENRIDLRNGATVNLGSPTYDKELVLAGNLNGAFEDVFGLVYVTNYTLATEQTSAVHSVDATAKCNMYNGVTIKDHKVGNSYGGGVTVEGGIFRMYGGTISNCGITSGSVCYGGGVAVYAGGEFIMDNGTITKCKVESDYTDDRDPERCFTAMGGGVFVTGGSTFIMNGGTISECSATNMGGAVAVDISYGEHHTFGAGNIQSRAVINGGTFSKNTADYGAGIFVSGFYYSYASAIAALNPGIGTTDNPGIYMNGGTVSYNNAAKDGGGIYIYEVRQLDNISLSNMTVSNNTASSGAGIMINDGLKKNVISGCTITNNASTSYGGGLCLTNNINGDTALVDTTITGNTTTNNNNKRGAGVYYDNNSKLEISGANIIQNNKYNNKLNNLNILSLKKPVYVTGDLTGSKIGVSDPKLWDDDKEDTDADAVSTYCLTSGFKSNNTLLPKKAFTSDHESWAVSYGVDSTVYSYTAKRYKATAWTPESVLTSADVFCIDAITFDKKATNQTMMYDEIIEQYNRDYEE